MNRLKEFLNEPPEAEPETDYWVVTGDAGWYYVSRETARRLTRLLARLWLPRWLVFTDLSGSEVRVLARKVDAVFESTAAQRSAERSFHRARKQEERADRRPWEED